MLSTGGLYLNNKYNQICIFKRSKGSEDNKGSVSARHSASFIIREAKIKTTKGSLHTLQNGYKSKRQK